MFGLQSEECTSSSETVADLLAGQESALIVFLVVFFKFSLNFLVDIIYGIQCAISVHVYNV